MPIATRLIAAASFAGLLAGPAAAQYPYPQQPYPFPQQQYPYPQQQYPYGYPQNQNVIGQIIDQLIGNRYNVTDRQAIRSCGYAAMQRAQSQYGGYPYGGQYPRPGYDTQYPTGPYNGQYPQAYQGYGYGYPGYMRIVGITSVERRSSGLRVRGLIDSGRYGNRYNYQNRAYGDLTFRCDVNYNGYVTRIRVSRN